MIATLLFLRTFAASREAYSFPGGEIAGHAAMVGAWPAPGPGLPGLVGIVSLTETQAALAVLAIIAALVGYHFTIGRYIREQAGVKDTLRAELTGQPIQVKGAARYVEHSELEDRLESYVTADSLHATERRLEDKMESNFRSLDNKRSASIGNLHQHLTASVEKLTIALGAVNEHSEGRTIKVHDRLNMVAENVGNLRGEIKGLSDQLSTLNRVLTKK